MVLSGEDSGNSRLQERNPALSLFVGPLVILRNLKENTNLLWNFIQRDIRLKYRNSMMGYFWSLLEPLILSGVYYVLFMVIAGKADPRYPLWVIIGVITWTFFSKSMNGGIISLTRNGELIKQVYLPREIFAITNVGSNLIITCLSLLIVIPFMIYLEIEPTAQLYMVPLGLMLVSCLGLGIGLLFSCLNTLNRDVEHLFRIVTRAGLFLSPVMWTIDMLPQSRQTILNYLMLNPMVVPITMIRNGIDGSPLGIESNYVIYSVAFCVSSLLLGAMVFKRYAAETVKYL